MSIFAPNNNIINELNQPPRDTDIGIICNIYDYDIELIQAPLFRWQDGFFAASMGYEEVEIPQLMGGPVIVRKWSAIGSAFTGTRLQYKDYKTEKLTELANKVPFDFIANELKIPVEQLTTQDVARIIDNAGYSPLFIPNVVDPNDIKFIYCRYLTINNTFIDCGLAEVHELNLIGGMDWTITIYDTINDNGLQPLTGVCDKCYQWIVYCVYDSIVMEPFDPQVFSIDQETGQIIDIHSTLPIRGKVFKKKKQAEKYFDQQLNLIKWFRSILGDCVAIPKLCYENNPAYDPEDPNTEVLAGPFDSIEECEQSPPDIPSPSPTPTPTLTPPPSPTPSIPEPTPGL